MSDAHADVSQKRGINPIWLVPIVAILLGIWMVVYTIQSQGPNITIQFSTAEGVEAGKTKIKLRNVDVGLVESVSLGTDLKSVVITASLEKTAESLLREGTQFWVVRPRIGKTGVSGLGTLLSGGYIQLSPGEGAEKKERDFVGLEDPPVTPAGTPGVQIQITADRAGSVSAGDPVLYRGYTVGRIETEAFDPDQEQMIYSVFIDAPYDDLLTTSHRFWDMSGISVRAGADGIQAQVASLETLLIGGVEVGLPDDLPAGDPVESGMSFHLYENYAAVNEHPFEQGVEYVVRFPQSVRGLLPGAPVEYRGLRIGEVERIMLTEMSQHVGSGGQPIPVLIRVEPGRFEMPDTAAGATRMRDAVKTAVGGGLRASLATGSLLTGSLYVSMDYFPEAAVDDVASYADRPTIPTVPSGLQGLEQKLSLFLDKLNELPLEGAIAEAQSTLRGIDTLVSSDAMQALPASLDDTLAELEETLASLSADSELQERLLPMIDELGRTLGSLRNVLNTLEAQPNALLFNREYREDPRPPAGNR